MSDDIVRIPATTHGVPRVRKKMPGAFSRPSINLGGEPQECRGWRTVGVIDLKEGDIVPGIGRVTEVNEYFGAPEPGLRPLWTVTVTGGLGNQRTYKGTDEILAFTAAPA